MAGVLWGRLDGPGHDAARVLADGDGHVLEGTAVFERAGLPCRLRYRVRCDTGWRTVAVAVEGWEGEEAVRVDLEVDHERRWHVDGVRRQALDGCDDIDLAFTPATNLLPVRRLALRVGHAGTATAAWLAFPGDAPERLDQSYERIGQTTYRYCTADGTFSTEIEVGIGGFVARYPGRWEAVAWSGIPSERQATAPARRPRR